MKGKLNNLMIQLRKNCNHPDLLESAFDGSGTSSSLISGFFYLFFSDIKWVLLQSLHICVFLPDFYPPVEQIVEQCGKFRLLERLLKRLLALKHKVCNFFMCCVIVLLIILFH